LNWSLPYTALYRLRQKYDPDFQREHSAGRDHGHEDQPRVPKGHSDGGQWTRDGSGEPLPPPALFQHVPAKDEDAPPVESAFLGRLLSEAGKRLLPKVGGRLGGAAAKTIESELALFTALSQRNSRDQQAVFQFNAKQFGPDEQGKLDPGTAAALTFAQVRRVCPGIARVKELTDEAVKQAEADEKASGEQWSASKFGTAVHTHLKRTIDAWNRLPPEEASKLNPFGFRAEVSFIKGLEENPGKKGTIRVDVLEKRDDGVVCVYDIKTGWSGLTPARMLEVASNVHKNYETMNFVITETRPSVIKYRRAQ
jgi:hypothetical protein